MALKLRFKSQDDIAENLRPLYTERNGEWHLDVEGAAPADELERVRQENQSLTAERAALQSQLQVARTEDAAVAEAQALGLKPGAVRDLRNRARIDLTLREGKPMMITADGKEAAITIKEWVTQQMKEAGHLFEQGTGSGAAGVRAPGHVHTGPNPFAKGTENLTEQTKLLKSNPELAAQLQAAAAQGK